MRGACPQQVRRPTAQAAFTLLEVLFGLVLLAVGLLAHASTAVTDHALEKQVIERAPVHEVARQFLERLRADDDFDALYERLHVLMLAAGQPGGSEPRLRDGRKSWPVTSYYSSFVPASVVPGLRVLVDVPQRVQRSVPPYDSPQLREGVTAAEFGLPADLNADGVIDEEARDEDYVVLPVVVILRWGDTGSKQEVKHFAWIGGDR